MEFSVSDSAFLKGDEQWQPQTANISHNKEQYVHFRVAINNSKNIDQYLWLVLPFPAIKYLSISDGQNNWVTGDAMPFSTRPVESPDYIFPVRLKAKQTTQIFGSMQGELLRYSFHLNTPESSSAVYRKNVIRDMSFFGAMGTIAFVCLVIFAATKYRTYLSFAVFVFAIGAWFFRIFGYGFEMLWPNYPQLNDLSYGLLVYATMISASWMIVSLLKRQDSQIRLYKVLWGYTYLLIICGVFSSLFLDLSTTLDIPLYWFFPALT